MGATPPSRPGQLATFFCSGATPRRPAARIPWRPESSILFQAWNCLEHVLGTYGLILMTICFRVDEICKGRLEKKWADGWEDI